MRGRALLGAIVGVILIVAISGAAYLIGVRGVGANTTFSDEGFAIERVTSPADANGNGVDDYWDLWLGGKAEADRHPRYDGAYLTTNRGMPGPETGVCTDLVWRAFRDAGYDLPAMINADIAAHPNDYPRVAGKPDPLIDYRRVPNLHVFLTKYAISLSTETNPASEDFKPADWQAGDIVTLGEGSKPLTHTGVLGPDRDKDGLPWIAHNAAQRELYDNGLRNWTLNGHFRFDASKVPADVLKRWGD